MKICSFRPKSCDSVSLWVGFCCHCQIRKDIFNPQDFVVGQTQYTFGT